MSGTFPANVPFATVGLKSEYRTLVSLAQSGRRQTRQVGAHRWRMTAKFAPMTRDEFAPVMAFMHAQEGAFGSFQITPPDLATPRGVGTGTPMVSGGGQTGNVIITTGWTANTPRVVEAGDILKFAGHDKVYMTRFHADADFGGLAVIAIYPALVASPVHGEGITVVDVPFTMALDSDVIEYRARAPRLYNFELDLVEVL